MSWRQMPTCRVCNEADTGFHYGVITCLACKGFFARSLARQQPYECIQSSFCDVGAKTNRRKSCPKCRYDKCIAVGMSRYGIKVGRYSREKKFNDARVAAIEQLSTSSSAHTTTSTSTYGQYQNEILHQDHRTTNTAGNQSGLSFKSELLGNTNCSTDARIIQQDRVPPLTHVGDALHHQGSNGELMEYYNGDRWGNNRMGDVDRQGTINTEKEDMNYDHDSTLQNDSTNETKSSTNLHYGTASCRNESSPCHPTQVTHSSFSDTKKVPNDHQMMRNFSECDSTAIIESQPEHLRQIPGDLSMIKKLRISENRELDSSTDSHHKLSEINKPMTLQVFQHSTMQSFISMFESFPFKSFEKESLAPILKMCAGVNYNLGLSFAKKMNLKKFTHQIDKTKLFPPFNVKSDMFFDTTSLPEKLICAQDLSYDVAEMEQLFEYFRLIHCRYYGDESTYMSNNEKEIAMEMFTRIYQLQDSLLGRMNIIDDETYFKVFETTGIDIDKRKLWFLTGHYGNFDAGLTKDMKFIRCLPGFKELSVNDRTVLAKNTLPLFLKLRSFRTTDFDRDVTIDEETGVATRLSIVPRIVRPMSKIMHVWAESVAALKDLDVSFDELIILKGACVVYPDFVENLEEPDLARHWQNTYMNCLLHVMRKTHGTKGDERFNKILSFFVSVSRLKQLVNQSRIDSADTFSRLSKGSDNPLFNELYVNVTF